MFGCEICVVVRKVALLHLPCKMNVAWKKLNDLQSSIKVSQRVHSTNELKSAQV